MPGPCPVNVTFEKKMWEMNGKLVNGVSFPNQIARLCQTGIIIADVRHSLRELVSNHDFLQLQKVLFVKKYTALKKNKQIERLKEFANRWLLLLPLLFCIFTIITSGFQLFVGFRVGFLLNCRYWGLLQKLLSQSTGAGWRQVEASWATSSREQMMTECKAWKTRLDQLTEPFSSAFWYGEAA